MASTQYTTCKNVFSQRSSIFEHKRESKENSKLIVFAGKFFSPGNVSEVIFLKRVSHEK